MGTGQNSHLKHKVTEYLHRIWSERKKIEYGLGEVVRSASAEMFIHCEYIYMTVRD